MDFNKKERGTNHYFGFGLQRTATFLVQNLIKRNWWKEHMVTGEWNKHDVHVPLPSGYGVTYYEIIKYYGFPAIFTFKDLVWWCNSMMEQNQVVNHMLHEESYMRHAKDVDKILGTRDMYKWFKYRCMDWFESDGETRCHTTAMNLFQGQYE